MKIKDTIKQYREAKKEIGKYFNTDIWYNIIFYLDETWAGDEHGFLWGLQDDEFMYGAEVYGTCMWEKGDYVLYVGDDGCGNRDMYLFSKDKKK